MKTGFIIILFSLLCSSCIQDLDLDLPDHEPKLVVGGLIKDNLIEVFVGQSFREVPADYVGLPECRVVLSGDGIQSFSLAGDGNTGRYHLPLVLEGNKTYNLEVSHPSFKDVFAKTVLVEKPGIKTLEVEKADFPDTSNPIQYIQNLKLNAEFELPISDFGALLVNIYVILRDDLGRPHYFQAENIIFDVNVPYEFNNRQGFVFITKENLSRLNGNLDLSFNLLYSPEFSTDGRVFMEISTISDSYLQFLKTSIDQGQTEPESIFTDPLNVYSNISNGYGYFGSQALDTLSQNIR